jgi:peptidylprolyl isomerase
MDKKVLLFVLVFGLAIFLIGKVVLNGNSVMDNKKIVLLETNQGDIKIELFSDMPITSGNFEKLVNEGFYDGILFHRIIDGFMIQGGDPLTKDPVKKRYWGTGGSEAIKDEFGNVGNIRGTISMANAGPNTGSSQFFINLVNNNFLDSKHPVFGKVVEGMDIVDKIAKVDTDSNDAPLSEVKIIKASLI